METVNLMRQSEDENLDAAMNWTCKPGARYLPRVELEGIEVLEKFFAHFECCFWLMGYLLSINSSVIFAQGMYFRAHSDVGACSKVTQFRNAGNWMRGQRKFLTSKVWQTGQTRKGQAGRMNIFSFDWDDLDYSSRCQRKDERKGSGVGRKLYTPTSGSMFVLCDI
jgi:hypothetical protein